MLTAPGHGTGASFGDDPGKGFNPGNGLDVRVGRGARGEGSLRFGT